MKQSIVHVALVVEDYDEAIAFYTEKLHFVLVEDTYQAEQDKRWVVVSPPGPGSTNLLLARASNTEQKAFVGHQSGAGSFYFSVPTTFGATTTIWSPEVSSSYANPKWPTTAPSLCLETCTVISGICSSLRRDVHLPKNAPERVDKRLCRTDENCGVRFFRCQTCSLVGSESHESVTKSLYLAGSRPSRP